MNSLYFNRKISQAKLHNAEIVLEKYKEQFEELTKCLKSKETKITELTCKVQGVSAKKVFGSICFSNILAYKDQKIRKTDFTIRYFTLATVYYFLTLI